MKKIWCLVLLLTVAACGGVSAAEAARPVSDEEMLGKFLNGPGLWRTFSELSEAERAEALRLQRENPEEFRNFMRVRAQALLEKMRRKMQEHQKLVGEYQQADPQRRSEIRAELTSSVREDFLRHLELQKQHLAESKRRLLRQEERLEQQSRECDRIIEHIVEDLLAGRRLTPPKSPKAELPAPPPAN